ncbi:MAG: CPBP family intramembrane metalloprotease [Chitinophagaceae bacterium]|nr:MAG: CPBP family intramembrane metalloprotease [Chitinophagaceae bacterium]
MLLDWIILILLIILPTVAAVNGKRKKAHQPSSKFRFYLKDIIASIILLSIFLVIKPSIYYPLDFSTIDKGVIISEEILSAILPIFFVPFVLSFTPWNNNYPKDITTAKELFGFPISYLPNTTREYLLFVSYIIVGVFFEELVCRQFIFYSLNTTVRLSGDILVIVSALLFAVGHLYQGWKGILSNFVLGLILGDDFGFGI